MILTNSTPGTKREKLGGAGTGTATAYPVEIPDKDGAFIMVTRLELDEGASISYHKHEDNEEVYQIISGRGLYCEEGREKEVTAGDTLLCIMGNSHGIKNISKEKLILGAMIAKK